MKKKSVVTNGIVVKNDAKPLGQIKKGNFKTVGQRFFEEISGLRGLSLQTFAKAWDIPLSDAPDALADLLRQRALVGSLMDEFKLRTPEEVMELTQDVNASFSEGRAPRLEDWTRMQMAAAKSAQFLLSK